MASDLDLTGLHIPAYMNLDQAMDEVRKYLESNLSGRSREVSGYTGIRGSQFSLQHGLIEQLGDISNRLGQVEPNSKLGAPGVFLKKLVRKAIGWYSRPVYEFDRTTVELMRQVRRDMLALQQQIAALDQKLATSRPDVSIAAHPRQPRS